MELAELHMMAKGPVEDLMEALDNLINDVHNKQDQAADEFETRTEEHNARTVHLGDEIDDSNADIARTKIFIDSVLLVAKSALEDEIGQCHNSIDANNVYIEEIKTTRADEHKEYEARVLELQEATEAIDESMELLSQITGPNASFA